MPGDNAPAYTLRKQRMKNVRMGAAGGKIKQTPKGPAKGVDRGAGLRTDVARQFSGLGPRKGINRMAPSGGGLRKIGPYKGPTGGPKPYSARQKTRKING